MSEAPPATPTAPRPSPARFLALIALAAALVLVVFFWLDTRNRIDSTQQELAHRLRDIESDAREARSLARQAQDALRDAQARVGQLEGRLAESQSQQLALETLYQELSRNRDEWQLAEIEQVLAIGSPPLPLCRKRRRRAPGP